MKTLIKNDDGVSLYIFPDEQEIIFTPNSILVGNPPKFIISDLNNETATLVENVIVPDDWVGGKYLYQDGVFTNNSSWIAPEAFILDEGVTEIGVSRV